MTTSFDSEFDESWYVQFSQIPLEQCVFKALPPTPRDKPADRELMVEMLEVTPEEVTNPIKYRALQPEIAHRRVAADNEIEIIQGGFAFYVTFTREAIYTMKYLSKCLERHICFWDTISALDPARLASLENIFDRRLAMHISLCSMNMYRESLLMNEGERKACVVETLETRKPENTSTVTSYDVTLEITVLIHDVIYKAHLALYPSGMIANTLDGYPTLLLSKVTGAPLNIVILIGQATRRFVAIRRDFPRRMPYELQRHTTGNCPLTGHEKSPLSREELEAISRYLGNSRGIYVHILLNCIFEFAEQEMLLRLRRMAVDEIITICQSGWFYLISLRSI